LAIRFVVSNITCTFVQVFHGIRFKVKNICRDDKYFLFVDTPNKLFTNLVGETALKNKTAISPTIFLL